MVTPGGNLLCKGLAKLTRCTAAGAIEAPIGRPEEGAGYMALDTMTQRCARLLLEGYKAAGEKEIVQLDGVVADEAEMSAGTPVHHACMHQLEYAIGAVVEEPVRGSRIAGATFYRITDRGFALLREAGYLL